MEPFFFSFFLFFFYYSDYQLTQTAELVSYFHESYELEFILSQANRKRTMKRPSPPILASEKIASIIARSTKSYAMGNATCDARELLKNRKSVVLDGSGIVKLVSQSCLKSISDRACRFSAVVSAIN